MGIESLGELIFEFFQPGGKINVRIDHLTHPDKRTDDKDAHLHCPGCAQDVGRHDGTVFRKYIWTITDVPFRCGRILRPDRRRAKRSRFQASIDFVHITSFQLKAKIPREPHSVPLHLLVQAFCWHAVDEREVRIEDHTYIPHLEDERIDPSCDTLISPSLIHWRVSETVRDRVPRQPTTYFEKMRVRSICLFDRPYLYKHYAMPRH